MKQRNGVQCKLKAAQQQEGEEMKTVLAFLALAFVDPANAVTGGSGGAYECKVDPRGVMVCYPKPRGF